MSRWFTDAETTGLDPKLVAMLDYARTLAGIPFRITSGLRTADGNDDAGGVKDSAHLRGLAVDLSCADSRSRFLMLKALFYAGFKRVGVYNRHLHVDCDDTLPQEMAWTGESH